jgi:hypothetical protein
LSGCWDYWRDPSWGGHQNKQSRSLRSFGFLLSSPRLSPIGLRLGEESKKPPFFQKAALHVLAESEGFEPSIQLPVYKLSRLARSTTLTTLRDL